MQLYQSIQTQLILTLVFLVAFVFQFNVITPLENELFPSTDLHYASLLFIPHGLKVLATYLMGIVAVPAVFIAQLLAGLLIINSPVTDSLVGATFGTIAVILPVAMINFLLKNKWYEGVATQGSASIGTFRAFIITVILSTFINSILHSAYYHIEATIMLPFRYLMGDMFGAILVFGTVMVFRRSILKFIMGRVHG